MISFFLLYVLTPILGTVLILACVDKRLNIKLFLCAITGSTPRRDPPPVHHHHYTDRYFSEKGSEKVNWKDEGF
jgi:hypothetical protein